MKWYLWMAMSLMAVLLVGVGVQTAVAADGCPVSIDPILTACTVLDASGNPATPDNLVTHGNITSDRATPPIANAVCNGTLPREKGPAVVWNSKNTEPPCCEILVPGGSVTTTNWSETITARTGGPNGLSTANVTLTCHSPAEIP